jgi:two-component system cell cycle response regulator
MDAPAIKTTEFDAPLETLSVLVVDDEPDCRESLELAVRGLGFSCRSARDGVEAWEAYEAKRADVILSDWMMPRMDGLGLCEKVRADAAEGPYTHFIFVTGNADKAHFIRAMRAGADDFLAKPVNLDELQARLEAAGCAVMAQRQRKDRNCSLEHENEHLRVAARTESLTDALNCVGLGEDLETLAGRALRYGHRYCAALCDVDEFTAYNDHFGNQPGDEVLRSIAGTIHGELRRGDVFYRYGGQEFLVILPEQAVAEAVLGMDRVRRAVERLSMPQAPTAARPFVTISVGVSEMGTAPTELIDGWLRRTDTALHAAKARGRNCVAAEGEA